MEALRQLAKEPTPVEVLRAFDIDRLEFGADYILPKPLDARLLGAVAGAVAQAAVDSGVARLPYPAHYPL
ncbi:NADP-dependent malic enzyme [compost metagenome]